MLDSISLILNWNTDYAEIPRRRLPEVIRQSYQPMISALEEWREGTVCFNITGHTLDYLLHHAPDLITRIQQLVKENIIELLASGYSHPILPLLPTYRVKSQIRSHIEKIETVFGRRPLGFWPPELAVSPLVLKEVYDGQIQWVTIDYDHFKMAQKLANTSNPFERREKSAFEHAIEAYWSRGIIHRFRSYRKAASHITKDMNTLHNSLVRLQVDEEASLRALLCSHSWAIGTQFALSHALPSIIYSEKKHFNNVLKSPANHLLLYGSDVEFWGYRGIGEALPRPDSLIAFLMKLRKHNIPTLSPSQIPQEEWSKDAVFLGAGSWAPDASLRIWRDSEDNREFTQRMSELYAILDRIDLNNRVMNRVLPLLRIAENSDARGWGPLSERKKEAYEAIFKVHKMLQGIE